MSQAETPNYPPIDRPAASLAGLDGESTNWTEVQNEAQCLFAELEQEIRRKVGDVRTTAGHTKGTSFYLFTYKTFSTLDDDLDPVVVGITFSPIGDQVQLEADISGDQTGDVIVSLPKRTVANSKEQLIDATRELGRGLKQSADALVDAIRNASRRIE